MKKMALRIVSLITPLALATTAFAQDGDSAVAGKAMAAGLAIGIAAFGCGLGQGRAGAAALEGIARNPNADKKIFTPLILTLALIESLAIYALVIAFLIKP